jgi:hypothetical protein
MAADAAPGDGADERVFLVGAAGFEPATPSL